MSFAALAWASKQSTGRASDKLVLYGLADRHNEECNRSYPSVAWLCDFGDLNRKTVIAALARLEAAGIISDSGERKGKTGQVKAYSLAMETVPKTEQSRKRNSSGFSRKGSQKRDTDTVLEPIGLSNDKPKRAKFVAKPDDVSDEVWEDFKEHRRKHGGITSTVITGYRREAERAGYSLEQAMAESVTQGWRGFKADWVKDRKPANDYRYGNSNSNAADLARQKLGLG